MKLTVSKSKNSASFYVQKTIRKPNGSVTTVTIEKLGNLAEVTAKAGGKDPYVWAQEYVNELNKSFPNRRTIENSDLCADTHEKLQFLGKVGYKQAKNNISGLEIIAP